MPPDLKALMTLLLLCSVELSAFEMDPKNTGPELLTMPELKALTPAAARQKLWPNSTNFSTLPSSATDPHSIKAAPAPPGLRVAFWNIERGLQLDLIRTALTDPPKFRRMTEAEKSISDRRWSKAEPELAELRRADIIILNEVDLGMKQTKYADVARELADVAGMNYVFGVEFVEVDGSLYGRAKSPDEDPGAV